MSEPRGLHTHPAPGQVIVLHSKEDPRLDPEHPAHAFGPFGSEAEARAFEEGAEDECFKIILDLVAPPTTDQVTVTIESLTSALHLVRHEHGMLWPPTPGCFCAEIAGAMWAAMSNTLPDTDERNN